MDFLRLAVDLTLEDGAHPNDIIKEVEAIIEAKGEWVKWDDDGRWHLDIVCSICGSKYPGICGHGKDPKQKIMLRSEYSKSQQRSEAER